MQRILRFEENKKSSEGNNIYFTDYEILSEVHIGGILEYFDQSIICGWLSEKNKGGLYSYLLRVKHTQKEYSFDKNSYSTEGYFFREGLIGELLAIFSVYFQSRFFLSSITTGELSPQSIRDKHDYNFSYSKPEVCINYEMFSDQERNWTSSGLKEFLDKLLLIDTKYHQPLILAFYWYAEAIKEIWYNNELFYIKMVSCVEALLKFYPNVVPNKLSDKLTHLVSKDNFEEEEKKIVKNFIKNYWVQVKFINFIQHYSKWFTKGGRRKAEHCYIRKADIDDFLKRIYSARSAYLHEGKSMYISSSFRAKRAWKWDLSPGTDTYIDRRKLIGEDKLPCVRWFERIVNHSLKNFIKKIV